MPRSPSQRLIVGQAAFALTVFESALDPVALPLHLRQLEPGCIGGGVRETVFDRLDRSYLAPDDQMPASRSFFLTVPEPDPTVSDVDSQLSARAVAQDGRTVTFSFCPECGETVFCEAERSPDLIAVGLLIENADALVLLSQ